LTVNSSGSSVWQAELISEKDYFPFNNQAAVTVEVKGKARVLALHREPAKLRHFTRALEKQGVEIDVRGRFGLPENISGMLEFDTIMVSDFPATSMTPVQMQDLRSYVMDYGGGFIMLGSENSFGLGGYYRTPVEEILPVVSRYEKEKEQPSLAMVLVIDKSGSMSGRPIALAREAAKATVELLSHRDQIAIVAFDGQPFLVSEMTSAANTGALQSAIEGLGSGGGTNMYPAMVLGKEQLGGAFAKIKHMIILSDGRSQPGDFAGLAAEMADLSMTVSTVALGGADRALMQRIADLGRGRYYETMDADSVPQIFTKETLEASRSAIREEPFVPVKVADADFLQEIDFRKTPYLLGYVMTRIKPTAKTLLLTESADPLLAFGRFGLGRSVAFTSDVTDLWAGEWLEWQFFGQFWSQIIRFTLRKGDSSGIQPMVKEAAAGQTKLIVKRRNILGRPLNGIKWQVELKEKGRAAQPVELKETGLGRYEGIFSRSQIGASTIRLQDASNNQLRVMHQHRNYPREYLLNRRIPEGLKKIPALPDSSLLPGKPLRIYQDAQNYFLALAMICLLSGVLCRRL